MAGFVAALAPIEAMADDAPGFVWRLQDDAGHAGAFRLDDGMVQLSVWENLSSLREFTSKGDHLAAARERRRWFGRIERRHLALWWVPAGHLPTLVEAAHRLDHLQRHGPTPTAFTFASSFPEPAAGE